jgi:hypothetical protein
MLKHGRVVIGRSLVPLLFVGSLVVLAAASVWVPLARSLLAAEIAAWLGAAFGSGCSVFARSASNGGSCRVSSRRSRAFTSATASECWPAG